MPPPPYLLYLAMLIIAGSIAFHLVQKERWALAALLLGGFCLYFYSATLYPFLNLWDERFHALVAKNFLEHPLKPTLYDEKFAAFTPENWSQYHIWLHKQPLFIWQMSIGFKLFGLNETAMRIPNVILCVVMVYAAYRCGYLLGNKNIAFYIAFFTVTSCYTMKLVSGRYPSDQNDTSFLAYCTLSIWSWIEYEYSRKTKWLIFIGGFSGAAILCKWLAGLVVYAAWGTYSILVNKAAFSKYKNIFLAMIITTAVALPWQIFSLFMYPAEARAAYDLNSRHFSEPVDGHAGSYFYHFEKMSELFGPLIPYLILPAFVCLLFRIQNKKLGFALLIVTVFVYTFFTLAATKMPSFTVIAMLPIFLAMAFLADELLEQQKVFVLNKYVLFILLGMVALMRTEFSTINRYSTLSDTDDLYYRKVLGHNKEVLSNLELPAGAVLFNNAHFIETMFYAGYTSFMDLPSKELYEEVKNKNRPIVILTHGASEKIPDYLSKDPSVRFIPDPCFD